MTDRRTFVTASFAAMAASLITSREVSGAPTARTLVQRDMPAVNLDGWQVTAVEVTYPPGESSSRHSHPGFVVGYVLRGQYSFAVNSESPRVLAAGEMFFESPGDVHSVSGNASTTETATILAMVFTPKDQPVSVPGD
jgi:quercetin dioxygenase-like cupin family protein